MTKGTVRFLDTNVLLRYLLRDDEEKAKRALGLLSRMEQGRERVATSPMVIFEVVFTLQRRHQVPRQQIRDSLKDILSWQATSVTEARARAQEAWERRLGEQTTSPTSAGRQRNG